MKFIKRTHPRLHGVWLAQDALNKLRQSTQMGTRGKGAKDA